MIFLYQRTESEYRHARTEIYGADTLADYEAKIDALCSELADLPLFQSNHERDLGIQNAACTGTRRRQSDCNKYCRLSSIALRDALSQHGPKIEVHANMVKRKVLAQNFISAVCDGVIVGKV